MDKREECVVALSAAAVCSAGSRPAVWIEHIGIRTPEFGIMISSFRTDGDNCSLGDGGVEDGRVFGCFTEGKGERRIEAEDLVADRIKVRKAGYDCGRH